MARLPLLADAGQENTQTYQSAIVGHQPERICRHGKPEPLKHDLTGYWSRRIDEVNRLVYRISDDVIEVIQCRGHYKD